MDVDDGEGRDMIRLKGAMRLLKGKDTGEDKRFCCACGGSASVSVGGGELRLGRVRRGDGEANDSLGWRRGHHCCG